MNLVAFTRGLPGNSTVATLAASAGAVFVIRSEPVTPVMRLRPYLPGSAGTDFALENLKGYLLRAPQPADVRLGP